MHTDDTKRADSVTTRRYAPPGAAATAEQSPRPVGVVGVVLYIALAALTVASAFEVFPLGSPREADTIFLGGVAGAYTWGRHHCSRWLGFGIGLVLTFLAIGFAIYLRHATGLA